MYVLQFKLKKCNLKSNLTCNICTDFNNKIALNLMNTVPKRSKKFRIAKNGKITHTLQLTLVSPQNPLPNSVRVSIYIYIYIYIHFI